MIALFLKVLNGTYLNLSDVKSCGLGLPHITSLSNKIKYYTRNTLITNIPATFSLLTLLSKSKYYLTTAATFP